LRSLLSSQSSSRAKQSFIGTYLAIAAAVAGCGMDVGLGNIIA
jgi:hypothetical protein